MSVKQVPEWVLKTSLDGVYNESKWVTYEGALAHRDNLIAVRPIKVNGYWRPYAPSGWTSLERIRNAVRERSAR